MIDDFNMTELRIVTRNKEVFYISFYVNPKESLDKQTQQFINKFIKIDDCLEWGYTS